MSDPAPPWSLDRYAQRAGWRRLLLAVLVIATAAFGAFLMWKVLAANGVKAAEVVFLAIFVVLFAWTALSFWSGFFGFVLGVLRLHPVTLRRGSPADGDVPALRERTAILIPVYNEDPARRLRPARGELPLARSDRPARRFPLLHAERHDECRDRPRRGAGLVGAARAAAGGGSPVLSPARSQCRQEGRQHRRMDRDARCRLRAHDHPRRRQHHGRRHRRAAGGPHGSQPADRHHPDPHRAGRPRDPVRARAPVFDPHDGSGAREGHELLADGRSQLLRPQCDPARLRPSRRAAACPCCQGRHRSAAKF